MDVIERLSSKRVLTSKWIAGASPNALLTECEALPEGSPERAALRTRLVRMVNLGVECSLSQLLETGVMHADPHPGNLILTPADRLAYLDFGLLTFVPPRSSEVRACALRFCLRCWPFAPVATTPDAAQAMMSCLVHVALGRWRAMADDLGEMGFLKDKIDRDALAAALEVEVTHVWPLAGSFGADSFLTDGSAQEGGMLAERIADGRVRTELGLGQGLSFGKLAKVLRHASARSKSLKRSALPIPALRAEPRTLPSCQPALDLRPARAKLQAIIKLAIRFRFNLPPYYTLIVRSLCSLEGLALRVDPTFSIVNAAIPIILRRMLTDPRRSAVGLLRELLLEEDARLRVGMLEGLLKNYSAEAGKSMQDAAAQNVVLKGAPSRADAARNGAGPAPLRAPVGASSGEDAVAWGGRVDSRGVAVVAQAVADERTLQHGGRTADFAGPAGVDHEAIRGNGAPTAVAEDLRGMDVAADAEAGVSGDAVGAAAIGEGEAAGGAEGGGSLEAQVLGMVLSARAAGVRRVLLEADMKVRHHVRACLDGLWIACGAWQRTVRKCHKPVPVCKADLFVGWRHRGTERHACVQDMYEQVAGEDGAALRDRAAEVLSGVVTWSAIPKLLATSLVLAVRLVAGRTARLLRLPRRAAKRGRRRRTEVLGVPLSAAAMKRAQLMAVLSFSKLWRQSWLAAVASVWLGVRIVMRALFMGKSESGPQAQAA